MKLYAVGKQNIGLIGVGDFRNFDSLIVTIKGYMLIKVFGWFLGRFQPHFKTPQFRL